MSSKWIDRGEEYRYNNAVELVHNNGSKDRFGYRRFLETMASYQTREPPIVLPDMWGQTPKMSAAGDGINRADGNVTLFAFIFTPDGRPDEMTFHPPQSWNVHLQLKLYTEFANVMEIDNNNSV